MQEQEIVISQDIYRDSSMSMPKEIPENRGTMIFVNIYFGYRFLCAFLAGFVPTVLLLILTEMTQWKPVIMVNAPFFVAVGILFPFISIYSLYLLFKVRTMSYKGWLFAFTVFIEWLMSYLVMGVISWEMAKIAVEKVSGDPSEAPSLFSVFWSSHADPTSLTFLILDLLIFITVIFFWFKLKKKFTSENSKLSKKAKYLLLAYTTFILIAVTAIYAPFLFATQEKPLIGYNKATKDLGQKPVLFDLPSNYKFDYLHSSNGNDGGGAVMIYIGGYEEKTEKNQMNMVWIMENTKDESMEKDISEYLIINNERIGYIKPKGDESKRHALIMHKNGLLVMIMGIDYRNVSKQTLINIAKTTH